MPMKPESVKRPWIVKTDYNAMQGQGRKIRSTFYKTRTWQKFRERFIRGYSDHLGTMEPHPNRLCIECRKRNAPTLGSIHVDHIKPINPANPFDTMEGFYGEPLTWTNCQPLCESCHNKKSARERNQ